jgi:formylglycine-generating enzyme required for sulfatase activity
MRSFASISIIAAMLIIVCGCSFWEDLPVEEPVVVAPRQHSGGMVLINAADSSFEMGSNINGESGSTWPVHKVTFTYDFWMDTTEVTQEKFDAVMEAAYPEYLSGSWDEQYGKGARYPVNGRNWYDAALYCNALSNREGLDMLYEYDSILGIPGDSCRLIDLSIDATGEGYRLPTEAEWEYSCRAGTTGEFYWGNGDARTYAWYSVNGNGTSNPVAQKKPNAFGLYDMSGNVWEWCNDWKTGYSSDSATDPTGAPTGEYRVLRGGSCNEVADAISSSTRYFLYPPTGAGLIGFRVVKRKT